VSVVVVVMVVVVEVAERVGAVPLRVVQASRHELGLEFVQGGQGVEVEAAAAQRPLEGLAELARQNVVQDGVHRGAQEVQHPWNTIQSNPMRFV
jgi:hypothetical protein